MVKPRLPSPPSCLVLSVDELNLYQKEQVGSFVLIKLVEFTDLWPVIPTEKFIGLTAWTFPVHRIQQTNVKWCLKMGFQHIISINTYLIVINTGEFFYFFFSGHYRLKNNNEKRTMMLCEVDWMKYNYNKGSLHFIQRSSFINIKIFMGLLARQTQSTGYCLI